MFDDSHLLFSKHKLCCKYIKNTKNKNKRGMHQKSLYIWIFSSASFFLYDFQNARHGLSHSNGEYGKIDRMKMCQNG